MRAGGMFLRWLEQKGLLGEVCGVRVELMGSLAATGIGHGTDGAVVLGLTGMEPELADPDRIPEILGEVKGRGFLRLGGQRDIGFSWDRDIAFSPRKVCRYHTNALDFRALSGDGTLLAARRYFSVGGGFVVAASEEDPEVAEEPVRFSGRALPYRFRHMSGLIALAERDGLSVADIMRCNEQVWRSGHDIDRRLDGLWKVMRASMDRGLSTTGLLPGSLRVSRRAASMKERLAGDAGRDPLAAMDWISAYAFAVSEENAAGGRVVTSPTNGSSGVLPAVLRYYEEFVPGASTEGVRDFLLTAGAVGILFKNNASISGAEVGCQGEIGVACSMAAAGLAAVLGGTPYQVENAAEIGIEHHLGLTCDPVEGQVQIPCIERNAMSAIQAVAAARLAMAGNGRHYISFDEAVSTMLQTGRDMCSKYKETSEGGLATCILES